MFDKLVKAIKTKMETTPKEEKKQEEKSHSKKFKKKKGDFYEKYVARYYENKGYIVKFNGIEQGKKDSSIDLIAIKKDEIILIQCKNWKENGKWKINHEKIKSFIGDSHSFLEKNPQYKEYKIKRIFAVSNRILDKSAINYIKENPKLIRYLHLPVKTKEEAIA